MGIAESGRKSLILAVETATRAGSIAVARDGEILASRAGDASMSHSTNLVEMIDDTLKESGLHLAQIDLFAAAFGPGSFTGLRIGLATVKALAVCTRRTIVGISTLAAMAHGAGVPGEVVSLLRAGRGEFFVQLFSVQEGEVNPIDDAAHLAPEGALAKYEARSPLRWVGEEIQLVRNCLTSSHGDRNWAFVSSAPCLARSVALLGLKGFQEGKSAAPELLRAEYVRASDAEIKERWQQLKAVQPEKSRQFQSSR